jgi:hypothetical protein
MSRGPISRDGDAIDTTALAEYLAALDATRIAAICADYRPASGSTERTTLPTVDHVAESNVPSSSSRAKPKAN